MWLLLIKPIASAAWCGSVEVTALARIKHPAAVTIVVISVPSHTPSARLIDVGSLAYSALYWTLADAIMG
jgi:hypothetical protein